MTSDAPIPDDAVASPSRLSSADPDSHAVSAALPRLAPSRRTTVFSAEQLGCGAVRIPALLRCQDGRLLVFGEKRYDGPGDAGHIEVVAATSTPGAGWSGPRVVASYGNGTMGNPVPIEVADGTVVLLTTSNGKALTEQDILAGKASSEDRRRAHVTRMSSDLSWVEPATDITSSAVKDEWRWYATGPAHGVRLRSGCLVAPANHSTPSAGSVDSVYGAHGLISDDDGITWRIGWVDPGSVGLSGPNESSLALDPENPMEVIVTSRNECRSDQAARSISRTSGGGTKLEQPQALTGFVGPRIQCGLGYDSISGTLLLTSPGHPGQRADLTLSAITGSSSQVLVTLDLGPCGYSDIATDANTLYVLFETGDDSIHERIELLEFDLDAVHHYLRGRSSATAKETP